MMKPIDDRISEKVVRNNETGCLLFLGSTTKGYGQIGRGRRGEGTVLVHRHVWERENGPIPDGLLVLHTCDVRNCCEISHLFLGTEAINTQDMLNKQREARGEKNGVAKLTDDLVRLIRSSTLSVAELASITGVTKSNIHCVRSGKTWKHVT